MKIFKKSVSVILAASMLLVSSGILTAFAAKLETKTDTKAAGGEEIVIFADDFEAREVGCKFAQNKESTTEWSDVAVSATASVSVAEIDGGHAASITNSAEKRGAPRLGKLFYTDQLTNAKISFRVKADFPGENGFASFIIMDGNSNAFQKSAVYKDWTSFEYNINFVDGTYTVSQNGKESQGAQKLAVPLDSQMLVRFAANIQNNATVYYDDVKITTTDKIDPKDCFVNNVQKLTMSEYGDAASKVCTTLPEPTVIPDGKYKIFTYDGNNGSSKINTGTDASWTKRSSADIILPVTVSKNECLIAVNATRGKNSGYMTKAVHMGEKPENLTVEYAAYIIGNGETYVTLSNPEKAVMGTEVKFGSTTGLKDGWHKIKYIYDLKKSTYTAYLDGKVALKSQAFIQTGDYGELVVSFYMNVTGDSRVLLDNVAIYSDKGPVYTEALYGTQGVQWDMIKGDDPETKKYISSLRPHPRVLVNSWDEIKNKIETNERCAEIYSDVMKDAEAYLKEKNVEYTFDNGRNWLTGARNVRNRLLTLGMAYGTTGDRKYIDRAISEMRNAATFPDWSNGYAPIIPAEAMMGYAIAYDWMYYGLTEAERQEIIDEIFKMALWQFVHSYAGKNNAEIAKGTSNRTIVANSCAVMCAIAIADKYPDLAEYIIPNAIKYALPAMKVYNDDGGFPEGTMYWEYATRFSVLLMSSLINSVDENYAFEGKFKEVLTLPSMKNTPKYCVYLNSVRSKFNFGDATENLNFSPILYFFAKYSDNPFYQWYMDNMDARDNRTYSGNDGAQALLWYNADMPYDGGGTDLDCLFNSETAAVVSMRSSFANENALFTAMQGGSNKTGHMGHSLGTFVIDANGKRFIKTMGASNYSAQFGAGLYYVTRTEGCNTILVNPGKEQGQDPAGSALFTDYQSCGDEAFSVLDMTKTHTQFADAKRGLYMTKGRESIILQDEMNFKSPSEFYWFAHTSAAITISPDRRSALLDLGGEKMLVYLTNAPEGVGFEVMQTTQLREDTVAADDAKSQGYKLAIHMNGVTEATLSVEFIPLRHGEAPSEKLVHPFKPISSWALEGGTLADSAEEALGDTVALKINSPVAFSSGSRYLVDSSNTAVVPTIINDRTLVPVRFISERFGAKVDWDANTRKVTVNVGSDVIELTLGSEKMYVNGEERILDVTAEVYNDRTLIPLRALVEALGKQVFWDNRGIIVISREAVNYSNEELNMIDTYLNTRVEINGNDFSGFTSSKTDYISEAVGGSAVKAFEGANEIPVNMSGNVASFNIGSKNYTITLEGNRFEGVRGTASEGTIASLSATYKTVYSAAEQQDHPWIQVENVTMSTGEEKYVPTGTIDNVINDQLVNRWSGNGEGAYLIYDFGAPKKIDYFGLATLNGDTRKFNFSISISDDNELWTDVLTDQWTSGTTTLFDVFDLGGVTARYVKVTGYGDNNKGTYNSWTEVRFWNSKEQMEADRTGWEQTGYFTSVSSNSVGDELVLVMTAIDAKGSKVPAEGVTFTSNNESVATVDASGKIKFVGKGDVTIKATLFNGFKNVECIKTFTCK